MNDTYNFKPRTILIPNSSVVLAYLAGIIDGEGSITHTKNLNHLSPQITVANTNRDLMDWLAQFGGVVKAKYPVRIDRRGIASNKILYAWRVCGSRNILDLLQALSPYLIIKKQKAADTIARIEERLANPRKRLGTVKGIEIVVSR